DVPRSGVHEALRQADETFAADLLAQAGIACAQHDDVGIELEPVDVVQPEVTRASPAVRVELRHRERGQGRVLRIENSVSGEMNVAIPAQLAAENGIEVRIEADGQQIVAFRHEG